MNTNMNSKKILLILAMVIVVITLCEMYYLTAVSLWHDESFSALLVKYNFSEMMERIKADVHPPLYYIFLKGWVAPFGNSLFSLRMFSVFFSILAILSVYFFIKEAFKNRNLALFSSLLYTLSYFQVQYAMEARMYSLGTFLVITSSYFFLKAIENKKWIWWFFYALFVSLGIYTHYFVAFWVIAQGIYLVFIFYREFGLKIINLIRDKNFRFALISYFLVFISYIPWLPTLFKQFTQVQESYWIPPMNIWSIPNTFSKMTIGVTLDPAKMRYFLIFLVVMVFLAIFFFLKRRQEKEKWLIFLLLIFPFLLTAVLSYKRSIYIDRYFIFGFPSYLIFIASAILLIKNKPVKNFFIAITLLGASLTFPINWVTLGADKKPGMAAAARYINQEVKSNEKIFVGSSLIYFVFKYYNQTPVYPKLYAPGYMPHFSGTALLSKEDIIVDFNQETKKDDVVWVINTTGFGNYQPNVPNNWLRQEEKGFQEVQNYQGWIVVTKYKVE